MTHPNPSGDLVIGKGLFEFLSRRGHELRTPSDLRCRWIYWKPLGWLDIARERRRALRMAESFGPDLWMTYHTYYKAPDMLGPYVCGKAGVPYVVFQGIYSTKRRREIRSVPGFFLNRRALKSARHVFSNRKEDEINLRRIVPENRLSYAPPGIFPQDFAFDPVAREEFRKRWGVADAPVVVSAAMFRPDVKSEGLAVVIEACGELVARGVRLFLAVAGDGSEKERLKRLAEKRLSGKHAFVGKIPREKMYRFYSAGDVFVFPGIRESLGMVYLEAQSCGLPVVAFHNGGIPEVVKDGHTGFLTPFRSKEPFLDALSRLLENPELSKTMGQAASKYVRERHDLDVNYRAVEAAMERLLVGC